METDARYRPDVQIASDSGSLARMAVQLFVSSALDAMGFWIPAFAGMIV
jgi:hypothetical protein